MVAGTGGSKFDTTSTAYVLLIFKSAGGHNMYVDSLNAPEWKTNMVATHVEFFYQSPASAGPGTTNNMIAGIKVVTKGSLSPIKIDSIKFLPSGCTNFINDVNDARCYYTHDTAYWYLSATQIPKKPGYSLGQLGFGYTPCGTVPTAFTLIPGRENYFWLVYDIKSTATIGNYVDADFDAFWAAGNCIQPYTSIPQTLPGAIMIDAGYSAPYYTIRTQVIIMVGMI